MFVKIMSKRKPNLPKLIESKLINDETGDIIRDSKIVAAKSSTTSRYFSPKKTRNKIKIEYDQRVSTIKEEVTVEQKTEVKKTKKKAIADLIVDETVMVQKPNNQFQNNKVTLVESSADETEVKKSKWEPKNWKVTLQNMRKMRQDQIAPVDTMGCHKCYDHQADEKTKRYHILVALMLSSQTKDQTNFEAMNRLKAHGLTPEKIIKSDASVLEKLINPVSFYKNKTKYIQKASQILIDEYASDIPNTIEGLLKLPGVGPKMAHICMKSAWNVITGIGVDTHVHRISNRLKWVEKPTKEPEQTRAALEKWLPFEYWTEVNEMMVGFGQTICTPLHPKCNECLNIECPSRNVKK